MQKMSEKHRDLHQLVPTCANLCQEEMFNKPDSFHSSTQRNDKGKKHSDSLSWTCLFYKKTSTAFCEPKWFFFLEHFWNFLKNFEPCAFDSSKPSKTVKTNNEAGQLHQLLQIQRYSESSAMTVQNHITTHYKTYLLNHNIHSHLYIQTSNLWLYLLFVVYLCCNNIF